MVDGRRWLTSEANAPFTRRRFLKLLGAMGGTGLVMAAMDGMGMGIASAQNAPPPLEGNGDGARVIILGAGLAGMTAAYELGRRGYETPILEARSFAGGRCQSARRGFELTEYNGQTQVCDFDEGYYINHGPWRIPFHHRSTLHYTREFGVPLQVMVNENDAAYVLYDDVPGPLSGERVRLMEVKADMRGYTAELLAKAANQGQLDAELSAEDLERLVDYLVSEGALSTQAGALAYDGTSRRGYATDPGAGLNPGVDSDPYDFAALLQAGLGDTFQSVNSYSQQYTMLEPIGGMDRIAAAFEERVGSRITFDAVVTNIENGPEGVRVTYDGPDGEATMEGDYCICTIPLSVLSQIPTDFPSRVRSAMNDVTYAATGKMGLQFGRRFWEEDDWIYGGHSITNFFGNISYPSQNFQGDKGVILGYYNFGGEAVRVSDMTPEQRVEYALENGSRLHPGQYRENFETAFSVAWHRVPYSLGGWASWSDERRDRSYPVLQEPIGRTYLAGEHLSYLTGWQSGAIESAWLQIEKIHQRAAQEAAGERRAAHA